MTQDIFNTLPHANLGIRLASQLLDKKDINPLNLQTWIGQWLNIYCASCVGRATIGAHILGLAQASRHVCVWITDTKTMPYAPDLHASGLDLDGVIWIRVSGAQTALAMAQRIMSHNAAEVVVLEGAWKQPLPRTAFAPLHYWARHHQISGLLLSHAPVLTQSWCFNIDRCGPDDLMGQLTHDVLNDLAPVSYEHRVCVHAGL